MSRSTLDEPRACVVCGKIIYLSSELENHHYPISKINGGKETIPMCVQCHSLVERIPIDMWPVDLIAEIYGAIYNNTLSVGVRLFLLKLVKLYEKSEAVPQELGL